MRGTVALVALGMAWALALPVNTVELLAIEGDRLVINGDIVAGAAAVAVPFSTLFMVPILFIIPNFGVIAPPAAEAEVPLVARIGLRFPSTCSPANFEVLLEFLLVK